jgi:CheY-like chemotaxis protein
MYNSPEAIGGASEERQPLRVLIADDCPWTLRVMQLVLRMLRCESDFVTNGREAVHAVRDGDYDIVLMDVMMPVMDGLEATRWIRLLRPTGSGPRIVGISADTMPEDRALCLAVGMDDFLPKPLDIDRLIRILDDVALGTCAVN